MPTQTSCAARGEEPGSQRPAVAGLARATTSPTTNATATSVKAIPSPSRSLPPAKTMPTISATTMTPASTNHTARLPPPRAGGVGCAGGGCTGGPGGVGCACSAGCAAAGVTGGPGGGTTRVACTSEPGAGLGAAGGAALGAGGASAGAAAAGGAAGAG